MTAPDAPASGPTDDMEIIGQTLYDKAGNVTMDPKKAVTGNITVRNADGSISNVSLVHKDFKPE